MPGPQEARREAADLADAGAAGALTFTVLVAVLHLIDPHRDPIVYTVSEYVLGPAGWLLTFAALALGLGMLVLAGATARLLPRRARGSAWWHLPWPASG